ncbi:MAG: hypothetical protein Q7T26_04050 [Dehalococcoidia bacterium]|nr:hypothetical protein [Dehalococcoidia bacterium]
MAMTSGDSPSAAARAHGAEGRRIGEVVLAESARFTVHCYDLHGAPPLGAFLRASNGHTPVYAVVAGASTVSIDAGRRPVALGAEMESEEEVYRSQPQLAQLFRTEAQALAVGFHDPSTEGPRHYLPPRPPRIHAFVYLCPPEEVRAFTQSLDFLALLANAPIPSADDVLAACVREAAAAHDDRQAFLLRAGRETARLLGADAQRLMAVLKRIRP